MVSGENIRKDKIICAIHADITASFQNRELTNNKFVMQKLCFVKS